MLNIAFNYVYYILTSLEFARDGHKMVNKSYIWQPCWVAYSSMLPIRRNGYSYDAFCSAELPRHSALPLPQLQAATAAWSVSTP